MRRRFDDYARRPMAFVEALEQANSFKEICAEIEREMAWFGFSCVTCFMMPGPGEEFKKGIYMNTRPEEYIDHYEEDGLINKDPVVAELSRASGPFSWGDVQERRKLSRVERDIIAEGREFDVNDGLMVPIVTLSGSMSVFSPCGRDPDLSPDARRAVELIALYAHEALKRELLREQRSETVYKPLTSREREVMRWVAAGKSDEEIGDILSIKPGTVTVHVENAKRKLDAFRRTFAVVKAIRYGEISI